MFDFSITDLFFRLPGIIIGLTLHELAHGYTAYILGDDTAKLRGRLTLNPVAHFDPIGFLMIVFGRFGWAKPVPINPLYFKERKKGIILVSLAGPLTNLFIAIVTLFIIYISYDIFGITSDIYYNIMSGIYWVNIALGVFNLIPIPPLDGSKILAGFLPHKFEYQFLRYEQYSFFLLIILAYTGVLSSILGPLITAVDISIENLVGLFF